MVLLGLFSSAGSVSSGLHYKTHEVVITTLAS